MTHPFLSVLLAISIANLGSRADHDPHNPLKLNPSLGAVRRFLWQGGALFVSLWLLSGQQHLTWRKAAASSAYLVASFGLQKLSILIKNETRQQLFLNIFDLGLVFTLAGLLSPLHWHDFSHFLHPDDLRRWHLVVGTFVYLSVISGGGRIIRLLTRQLAPPVFSAETPTQLLNAGLYIGWLERFLVITAVAIQAPVLVGLILTGKSIARFPEFKEPKFAEYFLVGTLLSLSLGVIGGLIIAHTLYGTYSLK